MAKKKSLPYRPCVGIMLLNKDNKVWVGQREDTPGAWQMPQGGIDKGEKPKKAAFRELEEEIGTQNAAFIAKTKGWLKYDLPKDLIGKVWGGKYRGQKQKWFTLRFLGRDDEINIITDHPEFDRWMWADFEELPNLIVPFKRDVYQQVVDHFRPIIFDQ